MPLADDQRLPLYLQAEGAKLQLDSGVLPLTRDDDEVATAPLAEVSDVVLIGPVIVTTPCLHALLRADIPVSWHTMGGWFLGHTSGLGVGRLGIRLAQYRAGGDGAHALGLARSLVAAKIRGQRLMLRRNHKGRRRRSRCAVSTGWNSTPSAPRASTNFSASRARRRPAISPSCRTC